MSTIKTLRDALESIAGLYEDNADANSIRQASLLYDSRCIARTALTEAAIKDAPALEAVPSPCIEDQDGIPRAVRDVIESRGSLRTLRALYRVINIWGAGQRIAAPVKQEAAPLAAPEGTYELARRCLWIAFTWNDHNFQAPWKYARDEAAKFGITNIDQANAWIDKAILATKQSPAATTNAKETTS